MKDTRYRIIKDSSCIWKRYQLQKAEYHQKFKTIYRSNFEEKVYKMYYEIVGEENLKGTKII